MSVDMDLADVLIEPPSASRPVGSVSSVVEKRPSDDSAARKPTPKRARYAIQACNECKRRKVKCDGNNPCHRCASQDITCSYYRRVQGGVFRDVGPHDNTNLRFRQMQIVHDDLVQRPSPLSHDQQSSQRQDSKPPLQTNYPLQEPVKDVATSPPLHGPTSAEFTLDVVKGSFKAMGFDSMSTSETAQDSQSSDTNMAGANFQSVYDLNPTLRSILNDPLWELGRTATIRLIQAFVNGPGSMYPVFEVDHLVSETEAVFAIIESLKRLDGQRLSLGAAERLLNYNSTMLKLVVAVALTLEKKDFDRTAKLLFDSIQEDLTSSLWYTSSLRTVSYCILTALLYYHLDEESKAGRFISTAVRICVELGLNRRESVLRRFPKPRERNRAIVLFWCVYMLDRRGSIGLGIPYILQDCDIDTSLPMPTPEVSFVDSGESELSMSAHTREVMKQYMTSMIKFTRLSGKACAIVNKLTEKSVDFPAEEVEYLDYQVLQWQQSLPSSLQISRRMLRQMKPRSASDVVSLFLRVVLTARTYQLRNLMFRQVLYSPSRVSANPNHARTAVEVAKELVLLLWSLNESTKLLRTHPVFFKHFLISAFSILLLSMANAWKEFGQQASREFYLALDLFKVMSAESPLVMRHWKTINGLEELAHKIGLPRTQIPTALPQEQLSNPDWSSPITHSPSGVNVPSSNVDSQVDFGLDSLEAADIRNEFFNFFDPDTGYTGSFFDFPLNDMFSVDLPKQ
ncbi:hypothetical protein F5884DRAFT_859974 [Xylogone sp. PMI_703]|nr:hypothetical protein F5884DRAFT_859974 [Xylogone sp. PMI_703]